MRYIVKALQSIILICMAFTRILRLFLLVLYVDSIWICS